MALRTLIPDEKERLNLKEHSRYVAINPDNYNSVTEKNLVKTSLMRKSVSRSNYSDGFLSDRDTDSIKSSSSDDKEVQSESIH